MAGFDENDDDITPEAAGGKAAEKRRQTAVAVQKPEDALPKIVAAGYGDIAEKILRIAFENDVKVRQDADLAEMLAALEIDSDIPSEALIAVAEILAYVYKVNGTYQSGKGRRDRDAADRTEREEE